jgi:hypothetical protein
MAKVKGSKQRKMVVVPERFWHRWPVLSLALLLVPVLLVWQGNTGVGARQPVREETEQVVVEPERSIGRQLSDLVVGRGDKVTELESKLVQAEQSTQVDRLALADLRVNIQRLRQQISQLEEDVLFYKKVAPYGAADNSGVMLSQLDIYTGGAPNRFRYQLRFENAGNKANTLQGFVTLAVAGVQNNMELTLPLNVLSNSLQGENIQLRFRSFQNIAGELELPADFEPARVEVLAVIEEPNSETLQKNFSWLVESEPNVANKK